MIKRITVVSILAFGCGRIAPETIEDASVAPPLVDASASLVDADPAPAVVDGAVIDSAVADATTDRLVDATTPVSTDGNTCKQESDCQPSGQSLAPTAAACHSTVIWNEGYCRSFCSAPDAPQAGAALTRKDCNAGSVCLPSTTLTGVGSCLKECTQDSDCRNPLYFCRRTFGEVQTSTGYCAPNHCISRCPNAGETPDCDC